MDRQDILKRLLYPKCKTALEFKFDSLMVDPLLSYITVQDIMQLNKIATSLKYSSRPKEKYEMIDKIMTNRGFKKMASGTNRVTYRCLNDYRVVIKIAIDKVGLSDNGNEYRNQHLLKPFVTKCFEVSPCGTVGLFERVVPITSREEFVNISDDIFDLINNLIGKFVLEDIGEKYYMNYGLREGFGPVLLDYPYVFELDGRKLICNVPEPLEPMGRCGGEIDYDIGYNNLICTKCGKRYLATELKTDEKSEKVKIIIKGEDTIMKCVLKRGDEVVAKLNSDAPVATNTIRPRKDFVNLKAQLGAKEEEEEKVFRPEIKTRDEVTLQVRLRGRRTSKDIDKEAREKEAELERITEKIQVNLEPVFEEAPEEPVSKISVSLSGNYSSEELPVEENPVEVTPENNEVAYSVKEYIDNSVDKKLALATAYGKCGEVEHYVTDIERNIEHDHTKKYTKYKSIGSKKFNGIITYTGEIWDTDTEELVGYTVSETNLRHEEPDSNKEASSALNTVSEEVEKLDNSDELTETEKNVKTLAAVRDYVESKEDDSTATAYRDPESSSGTTIGDIMNSKNSFKYNGGYKTSDIVSSVPAYLSGSSNESKKNTETEKEIPEVIIHPREEDDDYPAYDEEYDPEYSNVEEDPDEKLIDEF